MKIKWGALVTAGSGKIGGQVAARNAAGAYLRTKVTPINPQTPDQVAARTRLSSNAQAWGLLTQEQRDAWNAAKDDFKAKNVFGDDVKLSGINIYTRLNNNLKLISKSVISSPPVIKGVESPESITVASDVNGAVLTVTGSTDVPTGVTAVARATAPMSAGKNFVKSEFRVIGTRPPGTTGAIDISADYIAKFGALPAEGEKVFVEVFGIDETTGIATQRVRASAITVDTTV